MRQIIFIAALALLASAFNRRFQKKFEHLSGWQKMLGLVAIILAVLILFTPEFLALGLLGDASFFDVLVMALSLQMLGIIQFGWRRLRDAALKTVRRAGLPSPGARYLFMLSVVAIGTALSSIQRFVQKLLS